MEKLETNYFDEEKNYLFVRTEQTKDNNTILLDHLFIHFDAEDNFNFLAHFESYNSDIPISFYKLEQLPVCPDAQMIRNISEEINTLKDCVKGEQHWERLKLNVLLPPKWRMFFQNQEEKYSQKIVNQ